MHAFLALLGIQRACRPSGLASMPSPAEAEAHALDEARRKRAAHDAAMPIAYPLVAEQAHNAIKRGSRLLEVGGLYGLIRWAERDTEPLRLGADSDRRGRPIAEAYRLMRALHALDDELVQAQLVADLRAAGWKSTRVVFKHNLGGYPYPFIEVRP